MEYYHGFSKKASLGSKWCKSSTLRTNELQPIKVREQHHTEARLDLFLLFLTVQELRSKYVKKKKMISWLCIAVIVVIQEKHLYVEFG